MTSIEQPHVSIIVPSFNPGPRIKDTVSGLIKIFDEIGDKYEILVVSDGSTDVSVKLIDDIQSKNLTHLKLSKNFGKGAAIRRGIEQSKGEIVCFIDADGDIHPDSLPPMIDSLITHGADIVFGSKWHPNSELLISRRRKAISLCYRIVQRILFGLDVSDTQVGIKVYRRSLLDTITPLLRETRFALDLEIFVVALANNSNKFIEVPVRIHRQGNSSISVSAVLQTVCDLLRIWYRAKIKRTYLVSVQAISQEKLGAKTL